MKKIIAIIMVLVLSLTLFASCKSDKVDGGSNNNDSAIPEIKVADGVKEFKNDAGKVAYKVSYSVPEFSAENCEQHVADLLNRYVTEFYLDKAFDFAEINVKNFRAEETSPREIKISHEIKYHSEYIASVVFTTSYSKNSNIIEARTFNLTEGTVYNIEEFFLQSKAETHEALMTQLKEGARYTFAETELSEDKLNNLEANFDPINFWVDGFGITFVFNKTDITPGLGATAGIFEIPVDWSVAGALGLAFSPDYMFVQETTAQ
ncbi:MAG: hypothetical protein J6R20_08780 [Clostridia bacterium]|nr:hypothetical protein [Clostridia bacterium]